MPSEQAKKRAAAKARRKANKLKAKGLSAEQAEAQAASTVQKGVEKMTLNPRNTTGSYASHPLSRDIKVINFSMTYHGLTLFEDTTLELNWGRRYGLLGPNGSGKSQLLNAISDRDIEFPDHFDIFHLKSEIEPSDKTALEAVMDVDEQRTRLEAEAEWLIENEMGDSDRLVDVYERLDEIDADRAKARAARILHGLGFDQAMQNKKTRDFSGGWRMRISLARALLIRPAILLLDEPTNHLDLEACVWLEEELKRYKAILVMISHSQDFLNGVCTNIMELKNKHLRYFSGNYDTYVKTKAELEEHQMKRYQQEQEQIASMKDYIARFGHGHAKLARQAQSKEKVLKKMLDSGLTEKVVKDKALDFKFPDCGKLPPPVLMVEDVSFKYPGTDKYLYKNLEFGLDLDSRLALVGPNGAGKSTLLKLLVGELTPTSGQIRRNGHLRFARYHQHLGDQLDFELSPIEFMQKEFPEQLLEVEAARRSVGRYGLTGKQQVMPIKNLSDGQRSRLIFAWLAYTSPHMLILDEPTNHLDMETIDALARAINSFEGGVVLVSHDFRLIDQVADEIWIAENQTVTKWDGDIQDYKEHLRKSIEKDLEDE
ncbi:ABC transporter [Salpingoeca rosetta]|uniref:ABC transporter n=1 Tax=Salpingoeca rosetta (strain ATCC 50818 / BSB-021) TaxID=946362 RepID=F2TXR6_SALR5|nr:ABC transporter [Salpingoeca rosetta]EGD76175.1 ABC transporter [Salpingoeca rosetta]|eukprot:XP_004998350.1 ABC transporter [Salpingoeca rosetta]